MNAYEYWGFIQKDGQKCKLTDNGRIFARSSEEKRKQLFGNVIRNTNAYKLAIEWIYYQKFDSITSAEVAAHWYEHIPDEIGTESEEIMGYQVACFFQIAEVSGLGNYIVGRGGSPTRLEIYIDALSQFIAELEFVDSDDADNDESEEDFSKKSGGENKKEESSMYKDYIEINEEKPEEKDDTQSYSESVFISHGKNKKIVEQVKTMLDFADLDYEIAIDEETTAIPVPDKVLTAMRRCSSAVICVTADEEMRKEDGTYSINENVLFEIGAAFVLYKKKVVLVWDKRLSVPSNLQGLYRCEFEGNELSWSSGMKLMKAVSQFKKSKEI